MRFNNKDLAKAIGLKIGDRIKVILSDEDDIEETAEYKLTQDYMLVDGYGFTYNLGLILNEDFKILPRKKKVGDLICQDMECPNCPLSNSCAGHTNMNLYFQLETWNEEHNDQEIYNLLKARLDKEIEE